MNRGVKFHDQGELNVFPLKRHRDLLNLQCAVEMCIIR